MAHPGSVQVITTSTSFVKEPLSGVPSGHSQKRHLHCLIPTRHMVMNSHTHTTGACACASRRLGVREERDSVDKNANTYVPSRALRDLDVTAYSDMTGQMHWFVR